ncbi:hypothetical protein BKA64DRAFT_670127 [Cadophora sp. MPI-SDFR-AT-0126]|nr:hypothetical protein BKA64DRAFT_670127 [Leotiomycetes sp. MPI-SDFR-AT-0126]
MSTYLFPFKEDLCRFDFGVAPEDEYMCNSEKSAKTGLATPSESEASATSSPSK